MPRNIVLIGNNNRSIISLAIGVMCVTHDKTTIHTVKDDKAFNNRFFLSGLWIHNAAIDYTILGSLIYYVSKGINYVTLMQSHRWVVSQYYGSPLCNQGFKPSFFRGFKSLLKLSRTKKTLRVFLFPR